MRFYLVFQPNRHSFTWNTSYFSLAAQDPQTPVAFHASYTAQRRTDVSVLDARHDVSTPASGW